MAFTDLDDLVECAAREQNQRVKAAQGRSARLATEPIVGASNITAGVVLSPVRPQENERATCKAAVRARTNHDVAVAVAVDPDLVHRVAVDTRRLRKSRGNREWSVDQTRRAARYQTKTWS